MLYDEAFGPRHPRPQRGRNVREWEDPMEWVDLLLDAPRQVAVNVQRNRTIAKHLPEWQRLRGLAFLASLFEHELEDVA